MITLPCYLLFRDLKEDRLLVCFNETSHGLSVLTPCYLPAYAVRFQPVDSETGEIFPDYPNSLGDGLLTMPDPMYDGLARYIAKHLEQARRNAAADKAAEERKKRHSARAQRQNHDRQIAAQRTKGDRSNVQGGDEV